MPTFTLGQPVTSGPIVLSTAAPVTVADPNVHTAEPSSAVQVQNSSGYVISVLSGFISYTIQPFAATTIPTAFCNGVTITALYPASNYGNTVTLIWLLDGQVPPITDGPLTQGSIQIIGFKTATVSQSYYLNGSLLVAAPPAGFAWGLYSLTVTPLGGSTLTLARLLNNGESTIIYDSGTISDTAAVTFNLTSPIVLSTSAIYVFLNGSPSTGSGSVQLQYDQVPAPIG